jgi:pimeloyl-ACP methyl ester carboxylesterase
MPSRINPDALRAQLSPLRHTADLTADARFYQAYYGLDLPHHGGIQRHLGRFQVHGYEVVAQAWYPEQPVATLLVLHGYYDHMGLYRHVVDWGLRMGFAVLACDLPGHGLSSGPRASINEFEEYQAVLQITRSCCDGAAATLASAGPEHGCGHRAGLPAVPAGAPCAGTEHSAGALGAAAGLGMVTLQL